MVRGTVGNPLPNPSGPSSGRGFRLLSTGSESKCPKGPLPEAWEPASFRQLLACIQDGGVNGLSSIGLEKPDKANEINEFKIRKIHPWNRGGDMKGELSTRIVGVGLFCGEKVTLCWNKGTGFEPTGDEGLDRLVSMVAKSKPETANVYIIHEDDPLIAPYVFRTVFTKIISIECDGDYPTIPYEPGMIF